MVRSYTINEMLSIQDRLNELVCQNVWWRELTPEQFMTQVHVEGTEILQETGVKYKWWKKAPDRVNMFKVKMELIDIFHFYLSGCLQQMKHYQIRNDILLDTPIDEAGVLMDRIATPLVTDEGEVNHLLFNNLMRVMKLFDENIHRGITWLIDLGTMSPEEFCAIYAAKATLNEIRVKQGYGDGSYTNKPDGGMEDSMRLQTIIDAFNQDTNMTLNDVVESTKSEFFVRNE